MWPSYLFLTVMALVWLVPLLWSIYTSLRPKADTDKYGYFSFAGAFNLDNYVVAKTMDGLFYVMAEEEKKIRKDPMAQTTSLLREVFGRKP